MKKRSGKTVDARRGVGVRAKVAGLPRQAVFLVGFMGAGKSSVGRTLGRRLSWVFEDLDDRIERREGRKVGAIFRDSGEPEFRRAESAALRQAIEELRGAGARILALGGGAFVQKNNATLLQASGVPTVFLDAPVEELWRRCCAQAGEAGTVRPLLGSVEQFRRLYESRRRSYLRASLKIQTGGRTVDEVAAEIATKLGLKKIATRIAQGEVE